MTTEQHPPKGGDYYEDYPYHRRGISLIGILIIGFFAVASFWVALVSTSPLYAIVLPGNQNFLGGVQVFNPITPPDDKPAADTIEERINILVMGLDRRFDDAEDQPFRTDSVMVLTIDPFSKTAGVFSIPRDTRVEVPDGEGGVYMETRVNTVYEMGEYNINGYPSGYPQGGAGLTMDTIEHNFGIPIDHWVLMDWFDFVDVINEIGGIDIDVPEYVYDPIYSTCTFCGEYYSVEFEIGPEHMDGDRALAYARIRNGSNDFERVERQQLVLKAMAQKAASVETIISNPIGLYNQFKDSVGTDISTARAPGLALLMKQVGVGNLRTVSLAPALFPCDPVECGNAAEQDFDPYIMEQLKAQVFSDSQLLNENATIAVLNCTPNPGLAGEFSDVLQINGISSSQITTDEYVNNLLYDTTLIIDRTGASEHTLAQVTEWLGVPAAHVIPATDPQAAQFLEGVTSDIVVVLGNDVQFDSNGDFGVTPTATGLE